MGPADLSRRTLLVLFMLAGMQVPGGAQAQDVTVFAAASLKNALDAAARHWMRDSGRRVVVAYAASSALARQIEAGAPADLFIPADTDWMDHVAARGLIDPRTRRDLLTNRLVLVTARDSGIEARVGPGLDLAGLLGGGRLAMAHVDAVPAGRYGKAALRSLGLWDAVKGRIAQAENVRAALLLVSRGEAPLGIVYATDAAADPNVRTLDTFPESSHPPIVYPAALTKDAGPAARDFLAFLRSAQARPHFAAEGFGVPGPD